MIAGGGVPWDHKVRKNPDPRTVMETIDSGGRGAALVRWPWLSLRTIDELHAKARAGDAAQRKRRSKPLPRRHYQADWAAYGIAA